MPQKAPCVGMFFVLKYLYKYEILDFSRNPLHPFDFRRLHIKRVKTGFSRSTSIVMDFSKKCF